MPWTRRIKDGVDFTTFATVVDNEFEPVLNNEHDLWKWTTPEDALTEGGLHPGLAVSLLRMNMDELDIARAMAIDELTSPQRYQNLLLVAVRITGTGASYRSNAGAQDETGAYAGEYVWRDPSLYLNDGFLQRCQGLPLVMDHPDTDVLDTDEFKDRVIGTIMHPYVRDDEVWGIAKVYDQAAATLLETKQLSTSPGVLVGGKRVPAADGRDIFVEGKPSLLDHLAICVLGVWDKGGPAAGVLNQSPVGDTTMAAETKTDAEKIMDSLDRLHSRMDAFEEGAKKDRARLDSVESAQKDAARKDAEEAEAKAKKDAEEKAAKDAADEKAAKDAAEAAEKAEKDAADAARLAAAGDLGKRLDAVESRLKEPTAEERKAFVAAQGRADSVFHALGDNSGAPRWLQGETLQGYRKRLLGAFKDKSPAWKDVNLDTVTDDVTLGNIEAAVFKDAMDAARRPAQDIGSGQLRMLVERDETGRQIKTFVGDPEACWGAFKHRGKLVTGINTKSDR